MLSTFSSHTKSEILAFCRSSEIIFTKNRVIDQLRTRYQPIGGDAEKVTVGLASHWPSITDPVVYPPTGSMAWESEMSTPPMIHSEFYGIFTSTFAHQISSTRCTRVPVLLRNCHKAILLQTSVSAASSWHAVLVRLRTAHCRWMNWRPSSGRGRRALRSTP